jgi:hypothetical protein
MQLKPIDEKWMMRALIFVASYRRKNKIGPTWAELCDHMKWRRRSCGTWFRVQRLAKRGLIFTDEARSLDVSKQGRELMRQRADAQVQR